MTQILSSDGVPDGAHAGPVPEAEPGRPCKDISAEEMGASSFPASDPPATWTWDPGGER
jgi:hypothetical protein